MDEARAAFEKWMSMRNPDWNTSFWRGWDDAYIEQQWAAFLAGWINCDTRRRSTTDSRSER